MIIQLKKIEHYFLSKGFKLEDAQADDRRVGIFEGWVIVCDNKKDCYELSWCEALDHAYNNSDFFTLIKDFVKYKD